LKPVYATKRNKLATAVMRKLMSQTDFAKATGISIPYFNAIINGKCTTTEKTAHKIADYLNRDVGYFFVVEMHQRKRKQEQENEREELQ
jgi:transcriptional regulator with XRE-family HTH domain